MQSNSAIRTAIAASVVFALAFGLRLVDLGSPFGGNEILHVLAARSWLDEGVFRVAHGFYARNGEFTAFLGLLAQTFGESPVTMRMPAVLAGSLSVVALFVWMRSEVGRTAAWAGALILCGNSLAVVMSQWVRIYTIHALLFFIGAVGIYALTTRRFSRPATILLAIVSVACLWLSVELRLFSVLGIAGLAFWVVIERREDLIAAIRGFGVTRWLVLLVVALVAVAAAFYLGFATRLLQAFMDLQPQAAERENDLYFYHEYLIRHYPLFWATIPFVVVVAIARKPSFGVFCSSIFFAAFIVYSVASRKQIRYLYFVLPFLFALWGYAVAEALPRVRKWVGRMCDALLPDSAGSLSGRALAGLAYAGIVLFVLVSNALLRPVYYKLTGGPAAMADWPAARAALSPWLQDEGAIIVTAPMQQPLYYYGRADLEFGEKYIYESNTQQEFGIDRRTGLRTISTRESMELVFRCYRRGLFVMGADKWRKPGFGPDDDVFELLESRAEMVPLKRTWRLKAYAWDESAVDASADCSPLEPWDGQD